MKKSFIAVASAVLVTFLTAQEATAKTARCELSGGEIWSGKYVGPCEFVAKSGGSFSVRLPAKAADDLNISTVYVTIASPGVGEIAVMGFLGNVNEWGTVRRDPKKPACWAGEWGRVCVY